MMFCFIIIIHLTKLNKHTDQQIPRKIRKYLSKILKTLTQFKSDTAQ